MNSSNICKFTFAKDTNDLSVPCFVLESNPAAMQENIILAHNCVLLVTAGSGSFYYNNQPFTLTRGDLIFGFKGESFTVGDTGQCSYMYIQFSGNRADELLLRFNITSQNRHFENCDGLIPLWQNSLSGANETTIDLASESILLYTFSRLFKNTSERNTLLTKILKFSEEHFTNPELSLTALSDEFGYNPKYLSHLFKEKMNIPYSEYLRNLRIKYAISLFDHGIGSIKNVALLSGFSDPLYFSTVFKKSVGLSPTDYNKHTNNI